MEKTCSIREVAQHAGVNPGTVSRVLNGREGRVRISDATKRLIFETARELGYQPNVNAKRLFAKRSGVLGLVVPSMREIHANAFEDKHVIGLLGGLEAVLDAGKYNLMILFKDREFVASDGHLALFRGKQLDGLLIWGALRTETFWNDLAEKGYPHVFVTTRPEGGDAFAFSADYRLAGETVMRAILERGYRRILWAKPCDDTSLKTDLFAGFETALRERELNAREVISEIPSGYARKDGAALMERLCAENQVPPVLLCTGCNTASGAAEYCAERGLRIPEDLLIAACDSNSSEEERGILRIASSDAELGRRAAEALAAMIEGRTVCPDRLIPIKLCSETVSFSKPSPIGE